MSIVLFIIALILVLILGPISFLLSFFYYLITLKWKKGFREFERFSLNLAISLDQLGNVVCKVPLQLTMITKKSEWLFGNPDQTVSFVLAVNQRLGTLTWFGGLTCHVLDFLDRGHMEKAIAKQIEHDILGSKRYESLINLLN